MTKQPLILASSSPRRQQLLVQLGVEFEVAPQNIDESVLPDEVPVAYVERVAKEKGRSALQQYPDALVLAADTSVILDNQILGKPADKHDALGMLAALAGREHVVISAVTVANAGSMRCLVVTTTVKFRDITTEEALRYWQTGEPIGKAGGYGIQGFGSAFVENLSGSYTNVVGLPLFETAQALSYFNVPIWGKELAEQ
ncbi:MAG: nucleoside triphosphate pyrophosphatase [Pseudohongiellaceae bacterium]